MLGDLGDNLALCEKPIVFSQLSHHLVRCVLSSLHRADPPSAPPEHQDSHSRWTDFRVSGQGVEQLANRLATPLPVSRSRECPPR